MKIDPIEVYSSDLDDYLGLEIVAFHWAAAGACGEGGAVVFITTDGKVYHSNYVYPGFITIDDLLRIFPALTEFSPGIFGGGIYPPMWKDQYLGLGNYLVIHESICANFQETAKKELNRRQKQGDHVILYNIWVEVVLMVIGKALISRE